MKQIYGLDAGDGGQVTGNGEKRTTKPVEMPEPAFEQAALDDDVPEMPDWSENDD